MRRFLLAVTTGIVAIMSVVTAGVSAPHAVATDSPIGNLGDTLRVEFQDIIADVTVHNVLPSDVPPGWGWNGSTRWRAQGGPWRADVTIHAIKVPNPFKMAVAFTFDGVTPYDDAYVSKHTDDPTALDTVLLNAPQGSTVSGGVYWDVYRGLVTNVVLINPKSGEHLAQWNIWQPGDPLP
ncbi:MAG: hypothetical protein JO152_09010 [Mycobacteriaceae bacterium]|nr:hypothetical protein [Mycobacteriaceae bacterium]